MQIISYRQTFFVLVSLCPSMLLSCCILLYLFKLSTFDRESYLKQIYIWILYKVKVTADQN